MNTAKIKEAADALNIAWARKHEADELVETLRFNGHQKHIGFSIGSQSISLSYSDSRSYRSKPRSHTDLIFCGLRKLAAYRAEIAAKEVAIAEQVLRDLTE